MKFLLLLPLLCVFFACSVASQDTSTLKEGRARLDFNKPPTISELASGEATPASNEELSDMMQDATHDWFYGKGLGTTVLNVGTIIIFPPYALYLLGNAGLQLSGYEPLYITDALPKESKDDVLGVYDMVVSSPGRVTAHLADEEFVEK